MEGYSKEKINISCNLHPFLRIPAVITLSILLNGCAQIVKPTGGPKDTTPPKALIYSPENKSTHFNSTKIVITFNKYIQLKNIDAQLVISPPLKYFPKVTVAGGKSLVIAIKDTLHDTTTYTFNFGNSIADITEGNIVHNFRYVFSTGSYIDSLSLSGNITDALTQTPMKDGIVMLYTSSNDSAPYKELPYYYARSDDKGRFAIENIKAGKYRAVALSKTGTDYFYHPYTEEIGFADKPLEIHRNDTTNIELFTEVDPKLRILKTKAQEPNKILIAFNTSADSLSVRPLNLPSDTILYSHLQYSVTGDSAYYWLYVPRLDSLKFTVLRNKKIVDTASISTFPAKHFQKAGAKREALRLSLNVRDNQQDYDYHLPLNIQSPYPIAKLKLQNIIITRRKDTLHFTADTLSMPFAVSLHAALQADSAYQLLIRPGAFTDYSGKVNDTVKARFATDKPTYFGSLKLTVKVIRKIPFIIQLLDEHGNVLRKDYIRDSTAASPSGGKGIVISYEAIPPANYRIRAIEDEDATGKWRTGNYLKHIPPAKVYYFPQPVTIRSDWDITQDWLVQ
ncbi:MAG: hypothetical protein HKL88_03975 [Bacteroidia bacterium]|nr:hypothetical protein [Bacteroidia bacterium]